MVKSKKNGNRFFTSSNTNYSNTFEQIGNCINDSGKIFFENLNTFEQTSYTNNDANKNVLVFTISKQINYNINDIKND